MARALLREVGQSKHVNEEAFVKWVEKREKELWRVFKSIDTSGDNTLQVNELRSFVKKAGLKVGEDDFQKFVNGVVGGEGGAVGFEEWRDFLLLMPHKPTPHNILTFYSTLYNIDPTSDFTPLPETLSERDDDDASSSSPQPSTLPPRLKYFICGGMAGAVSRTATAPLDRVKVLLVTNASQQSPPPLLDTLKLIYSQGGLRSFYRGNMLNVIKIVPESGVKFLTFELAKTWIADFERQWESGEANTNNGEEQWDGERRQELSVAGRFCAGGMAGLVSQAVIYPLETVKVRWMAEINQSAKSADPTVPSTATISSSTGISQPVNGSKPPSFLTFIRTPIPLPHLYRGCAAALVGIVPYAGIDLGIYETLRRKYEIYLQNKYQREDVDMHSGVLLGIGAVSAISGAGVMYPLSVVRTRMQAQHTPSHPYTYTSTFDAAYKTYKIEGVRGFYKGIAPTLCKVLPAVSISYVVYEWCKTVL
ncbi:mitochondrial carrier domain-containing protein [Gaertneriomyces semiglobifer]|nr:mitochondrial carrier domain-containing protein [Gaertneriomyces semiglobifer]